MKYRICPVCDQKMKTAHYCFNCKAWVQNPWVREVDYYLNERHPSQEGDCSYHGSGGGKAGAAGQSRSGAAGQGRTGAAAPVRPGMPGRGAGAGTAAYGGAAGGMQGTSGARYTAAARKTAGKSGTYTHVAGGSYGVPQVPKAVDDPKRLVFIVGLIFFSLSLLFSIIHTVYKLNHPHDRKTPETYEYDMDLGSYDESEEEYWYEELSDEEARAEGRSCNGMDHFGVTGEAMEDILRDAMEEYGYDFTGVERRTENGRNSDDICWYEASTVINIRTEDEEVASYIEINSDTVTGQLHWLDIYLEDREHMIAFIRVALGLMEQEQQLDPDGNILELFQTDLVPLIEKTEGFDYILGDVEIYGTRYEEIYYVSIWPSPWAGWEEEQE